MKSRSLRYGLLLPHDWRLTPDRRSTSPGTPAVPDSRTCSWHSSRTRSNPVGQSNRKSRWVTFAGSTCAAMWVTVEVTSSFWTRAGGCWLSSPRNGRGDPIAEQKQPRWSRSRSTDLMCPTSSSLRSSRVLPPSAEKASKTGRTTSVRSGLARGMPLSGSMMSGLRKHGRGCWIYSARDGEWRRRSGSPDCTTSSATCALRVTLCDRNRLVLGRLRRSVCLDFRLTQQRHDARRAVE